MATAAAGAPGAPTDGTADDGTADDGTGNDGEGDKGKQRSYTAAEVDALVKGLRDKNQELIGRERQLKERVKVWDGKDPSKVQQALEHFDKLEEERQRAAGKFDELRNTLLDTHKREKDELETKLTRTTERLHNIVGTKHAMEEIQKVAREGVAVLLPHVEKVLRVVEDEDGEYVPRIVDSKGNERIGPKGDPMSVAEYLAELAARPEFAKIFDAPNSTGSGSRRSTTTGTGVVRISRADAQDPAKYRAARAEAQRRGTQLDIQE